MKSKEDYKKRVKARVLLLKEYILTNLFNKENITVFINEKWLLFILPLIYVFLIITPLIEWIAFIPDYLNISSINPQDYFGIIIGAISSIFGIVMAVVLLSVEFFKERISKDAYVNPLENQLIRNSIYTSISLIGISFLGYIQIESFTTSKSVSIGYYIGFIFIFYIYSVFPVLKTIIGKSSRIKSNVDLVNSISLNSFQNVSRQRFRDNLVEDDTLKILKKELDSYILSTNVTAYQKINDDIISKALTIITDGKNRQQCDIVIGGIIWLWRENSKTAIRASDNHYFETLWSYISDIYLYFADKKAPLLHLQDMHSFIYLDFFKLHEKLGNSIPLTNAMDSIEVSFKSNLTNNCPKQENLKRLARMFEEDGQYEPSSIDDSIQWDSINGLIGLMSKVQDCAINIGNKDLFEESIRRHQDICSDIYYGDYPIGNYQKRFILWKELTSSFYSSRKALEIGLYENTFDCFRIPKNLIVDLIERNYVKEKDLRVIISSYADYIILAFKEGKLSTDSLIGTLNEFCLIGVHCLKHYQKNPLAKKTVSYIIKVLKNLKKLAEKDLASINPNDYLNLKGKIKHFISVATDMDGFDPEKKPVKKWQKLLDNFQNISKEKEFSIIKWKIEEKPKK
ncbi:hypothetical protein ACFFU9_10520 [Mariniflexile ostreae]|uniref:DUF2254 domain-containing protein n=1 Tax=Mariniflexile ostreae TaxID=1520892 RepID=A0ABV5FCJ5_9FLAO